MSTNPAMSSNRPYLVRAIYQWVSDNGLTPYLLVDARLPEVVVPRGAIKDGQIVLNIAMRAVSDLDLGNDRIRFLARFGGVSQHVVVPVGAVLAIYAQENGQGMMFPAESSAPEPAPSSPEPSRAGPKLRVVK